MNFKLLSDSLIITLIITFKAGRARIFEQAVCKSIKKDFESTGNCSALPGVEGTVVGSSCCTAARPPCCPSCPSSDTAVHKKTVLNIKVVSCPKPARYQDRNKDLKREKKILASTKLLHP